MTVTTDIQYSFANQLGLGAASCLLAAVTTVMDRGSSRHHAAAGGVAAASLRARGCPRLMPAALAQRR